MTCLADGLQMLVTRDSKLRTPEILSSQTIAQISISLITYLQAEIKHTSTQTKIKENSRKTKSRISSHQATTSVKKINIFFSVNKSSPSVTTETNLK